MSNHLAAQIVARLLTHLDVAVVLAWLDDTEEQTCREELEALVEQLLDLDRSGR